MPVSNRKEFPPPIVPKATRDESEYGRMTHIERINAEPDLKADIGLIKRRIGKQFREDIATAIPRDRK